MGLEENTKNFLRSFFGVALAIMLIGNTVRDLAFYFDTTVVKVTEPTAVERLHDNVSAEISLDLDIAKIYGVRYLTQKEFFVIPFASMGYRLMYVVEGPITDTLAAKLHPPLKGRVVTKSLAGDSWDVFGQSIQLKKIMARDGIDVPVDAMLVYDAPKELPSSWNFLICALASLYLTYKIFLLFRRLKMDNP